VRLAWIYVRLIEVNVKHINELTTLSVSVKFAPLHGKPHIGLA